MLHLSRLLLGTAQIDVHTGMHGKPTTGDDNALALQLAKIRRHIAIDWTTVFVGWNWHFR